MTPHTRKRIEAFIRPNSRGGQTRWRILTWMMLKTSTPAVIRNMVAARMAKLPPPVEARVDSGNPAIGTAMARLDTTSDGPSPRTLAIQGVTDAAANPPTAPKEYMSPNWVAFRDSRSSTRIGSRVKINVLKKFMIIVAQVMLPISRCRTT